MTTNDSISRDGGACDRPACNGPACDGSACDGIAGDRPTQETSAEQGNSTWQESSAGQGGSATPGACEAFGDLLALYIDGELNASEKSRVEVHVASCSRCARRLAIDREVHRTIAVLSAEDQEPLAEEKARAVLIAIRARATEGSRWITRGALAGAALLVLAVTALFLWALIPAGDRGGAPSDDLLSELDILMDLEEEGVEPSPELLQLIVEAEADSDSEASGSQDADLLDVGIFDYLLEEEVVPDNL